MGVLCNYGEVIDATDGHPFYVLADQGEWNWVDAGELTVESILAGKAGDLLQVVGIESNTKVMSVFNITVNNDHTYYVGESGVLNHNAGGCDLTDRLLTTFGWKRRPSGASDKLRKNMIARGINEPGYKNAAHHIVGFGERSRPAQEVLARYGIKPNDFDNGVFLPTCGVSGCSATVHGGRHLNSYIDEVNFRLMGAESKMDVLDSLEWIRNDLLNGVLTLQR